MNLKLLFSQFTSSISIRSLSSVPSVILNDSPLVSIIPTTMFPYWKAFARIIIPIMFLFVLAASVQVVSASTEKEINVIFRFDDYSEFSNTEMELKVIKAFWQCGIPFTIGVIPFPKGSGQVPVPLGKKKAAILREGYEANLIDIALHGHTHKRRLPQMNSEFEGETYEIQKKKISDGKKLLEEMTGIRITTFVPPWNSYDSNTLDILVSMKFKTLSASLDNKAELHPALSYLPATCNLVDLKNAVIAARESREQKPIVVVLFHPYDFEEVDPVRGSIRLEEFTASLSWLKSQKDVKFTTITMAAMKTSDFSAEIMVLNNKINHMMKYLPFTKSLYYITKTEKDYYNILFKIGTFYLTILLAAIFLSFAAGKKIAEKSPTILNISKHAATFLFLVVSGYAIYKLPIHVNGVVVCTSIFGLTTGLWLSCCKYQQEKKESINSARTDVGATSSVSAP